MTAYRKVPFAYPLRMARKACRNANPSRPCEMANAQSDGEDTRVQEMSLVVDACEINNGLWTDDTEENPMSETSDAELTMSSPLLD